MSFFFEGNGSEPPDLFGAVLKGVSQGLNLGMLIGKGFMLTSQVAKNALRGRKEEDTQRQLEERWRNQQRKR